MQQQEQPGKHGAPYAPPNSPEYKTLIRQLDALLTKIEALPAGSTALPQLQNELKDLRERCRGVWLRDQGLDGIWLGVDGGSWSRWCDVAYEALNCKSEDYIWQSVSGELPGLFCLICSGGDHFLLRDGDGVKESLHRGLAEAPPDLLLL
jgi:hypothetical protein